MHCKKGLLTGGIALAFSVVMATGQEQASGVSIFQLQVQLRSQLEKADD